MNVLSKIKKNLAIRLPILQGWAVSGFPQGEIETIARHVADRTGRRPGAPLISFARAFVESATSVPNRFAENGERALLDRLSSLPIRTVFDVGANIGTWARHALKVFSNADVHAFEIVPATFAELRRNLPDETRLRLNRFGLSDEAGTVAVNLYTSNLISSMYVIEGETIGQELCEVRRGADYAAEQKIEQIDVLKIDVEGAEGKVLLGFEPMISERRVRLVQFEYNRGAILGDFLLKHAYAFFAPRGYRLGKLLPGGVHFHPYRFADEDFIGPNYVACRDDDAELIRLVSVRD